MKREVRDKRHEYLLKSKALRIQKFDPKCEDNDAIINEQKILYKKWSFYDNIIKAEERIKKNVSMQ